MRRLFHKALRLALATAVLTGSLVPPAFCHAHAAGARPHSHSSARDEPSGHDEHGGHRHVKEHQVSEEHDHQSQRHHGHDDGYSQKSLKHDESAHALADDGLERSTAHTHFSFFGFDFSFPHRDGSNGPLTRDECQLGVVRLTDDVIPVSRVVVVAAVDMATAPFGYFDRFDAETSRTAKSGVRAVDRILLCDSARFERSGVLLV